MHVAISTFTTGGHSELEPAASDGAWRSVALHVRVAALHFGEHPATDPISLFNVPLGIAEEPVYKNPACKGD